MLSNEHILDLAFGALNNAKRREIVSTLSYRPATVTQLAEEHSLSLPSIHRHIRTLENAGLIQRKKIGRINFVAIRRASLQAVHDWISNFHPEWGNDEESLENYISKLKR